MLWRIELFGGLRAYSGGQTITRFQTYKTGALLAYLAFYSGRQHPREELINILWPDVDPTAARNRLSQALVWLRPRLEQPDTAEQDVLITDRHSVGLHPDSVVTDISQLEAAIQAATSGPPRKQIDALRRAVDLYRGELLSGYYEDWVFPERQRYAQTFLAALRRLTALYEQSSEYERALDYARRALTAEPLMEEVHSDLIRLLAASGQSAAALRQYHELEKILADNFGETPSAETRALIEEVRQDTPKPTRTPSETRTSTPPKLPSHLTRFFGRKEEVQLAQQTIHSGQSRLITLIGPGGSGKTRLAIETVSRLAETYEGDIWFVPLADIQDARRIPHAIADIIRAPDANSQPALERVVEWLAWRPSLLVLDNLEHLIDDVAPLIRELLERAPPLTILTTSRQCVGISGEREIPIKPLPLPNATLPQDIRDDTLELETLSQSASIQLFVDRAQAVRPSFRLDAQNARIIAQICARLEGMPLATELCAAWAQTLTPAEMLEGLNHPFDLLVSRRREVPSRHRSLWAAVEYSYQQLTPKLQKFFSSLSVFRSGWTLEAAETICLEPGAGEVRQRKTRTLDLLTELRERSLITVEETGKEMRYRMLETLREFASEQASALPELLPELRHRHAEYYMRLAESAERRLLGTEQLELLNRLKSEHDNMRQALHWAMETGEVEIGLRLAGALTPFWNACGFLGEGEHWLGQILSLPESTPRSREARLIRAKALTARGNLARNQGNSSDIDAGMQEAIKIWRECGSEQGMSEALQILATLAYSRDDSETARKYLQRGLAIARHLQDRRLMALALHNLGNIALAHNELETATSYYTESMGLYRAEGNFNRAAHLMNNIGLVARYQHDYQTASVALYEALETSREISDSSGMALALLNLATIHRLQGHFATAGSFLDEAARYSAEAGERRLLPWCVRERGHQACAQGDYIRGVRLLAAAESQRASIGIMFKPADPPELESALSSARAVLGEERCKALWSVGSNLPHSRVYAEALHLADNTITFK